MEEKSLECLPRPWANFCQGRVNDWLQKGEWLPDGPYNQQQPVSIKPESGWNQRIRPLFRI